MPNTTLSIGTWRLGPLLCCPNPEYARLVVRQLVSSKVQLVSSIAAGAAVFPVGKKGSQKLREVWNGSRITGAAAVPPEPPCLASTAAVLNLECSPENRLLLSKLDGRCLFDQLHAPPMIRKWFGRPSVYVRDLAASGEATLKFLQSCFRGHIPLEPHHKVFPVSCVWPMGFSWSSYLAQCTMLEPCRRASLTEDRVLAEDRDIPEDLSSVFALATDDIMHFTSSGHRVARRTMAKVDHAFDSVGVERHHGKDVTAASDGTVIGIDFAEGRFFSPSALSLLRVMRAVLWLALHSGSYA